ncbi:hypothetical protein R1sor_000021 [Riccia sorocarpa]|uniref:Uncharacterized protein n=1 Tax=Riccia sorocarpa TaxID=122646 RepID=A0ABD3GVX9_9MARC
MLGYCLKDRQELHFRSQSVVDVMLTMVIVDRHYTPSTSWVINKGTDRNRISALWKCYVQPGTVSLADIDNVFFWMPHIQPSRYVEGTHHEVHILKTAVLEDKKDSDHSSTRIEHVSRNLPAHEFFDWASFILLVQGISLHHNLFHLVFLWFDCNHAVMLPAKYNF